MGQDWYSFLTEHFTLKKHEKDLAQWHHLWESFIALRWMKAFSCIHLYCTADVTRHSSNNEVIHTATSGWFTLQRLSKMLSLIILTKFGVAELITLGQGIHNLKILFKINPLYVKKHFSFFLGNILWEKRKQNQKTKLQKKFWFSRSKFDKVFSLCSLFCLTEMQNSKNHYKKLISYHDNVSLQHNGD